MNYEPLLDDDKNINSQQEKFNKKGYGNYDAFHNSGWISKLFFCWVYKILGLVKDEALHEDTLGTIDRKFSSCNYSDEIKKIWIGKQYHEKKHNALIKTILRYYTGSIVLLAILSSIFVLSEYIEIIMLSRIIKYFDEKMNDLEYLLKISIILFVQKFLMAFLYRHYILFESNISVESVLMLNCFIFDKILRISPSSFSNKSNQGEIMNFIQIDSQKLGNMIIYCPLLILYPIQIIVLIVLLFYHFGISFLFGTIPLLLFTIVNVFLWKKYTVLDENLLNNKDTRMKVTTETFEALKLLKMYSWEEEFRKRILHARSNEIKTRKTLLKFEVLGITLYWTAPILVLVTTIGVYQYLNPLDINNIIIGMYIFGLLQKPITELPYCITSIIDTMISMTRIESFIRQEEVDDDNIKIDNEMELSIKIDDLTFTWGKPIQEDKENENNDESNLEKAKSLKKNKVFDNKEYTEVNKLKDEISALSDNVDESIIFSSLDKTDENINFVDKSKNLSTTFHDKSKNTIIEENLKRESEVIVPVLKNIKLNVKKGEFIGIIGEVGSGKSSLIQAMMNNLLILDNFNVIDSNNIIKNEIQNKKRIFINGTISYTAQLPWIQNDTIKNNILFFKEYDEQKYKTALKMSQLEKDLEILPGGDMTEIGEKGINLSGGQKARVSLARALYSESDIYLLDDPISALDADVGRKVVYETLLNHLKGKTRILATHNIQYLQKFDRIIWLEDGKIIFDGDFEQLEKQEFYLKFTSNLTDLKSRKGSNSSSIKTIEKTKCKIDADDQNDIILDEQIDEKKSNGNEKSFITEDGETDKDVKKNIDKGKICSIHKIIQDEDQEIGNVKFSVFVKYFSYMGGKSLMSLIFIVMMIWQALKAYSNIWLTEWTKEKNQNQEEKWISFAIYSSLSLGACIFIFLRLFFLSRGTLRLGNSLHKHMIDSLVRAPINLFHDSTPKGRILNRLTKDLENIDFCMFTLGSLLVSLFSVIGSIVICGLYEIYTLTMIPFILIIVIFMYRFYVQTSRDLKRLEGVTRSPILNIVSEIIPGAISVRTCNTSDSYKNKFYRILDNNLKVNIFSNGCYSWFGLNIDLIGLAFLFGLIAFIIVFREKFDPQAIGLMITYCLDLQYEIFDLMTNLATYENNMVSMERCLNFTKIPQEKESITERDGYLLSENDLSSKGTDETNVKIHDQGKNEFEKKIWPEKGMIEFVNYSVKYRPDTPIVLDNLNFKIIAGEKVGIVGRTGSGKSTICNCLFRIIEPAQGTIYIDGEDISKIGLEILRKNITIIPQDPCILMGTLKYNVDPINKFSDEQIEKALNMVGFNFSSEEKGIYKEIGEQGGNLSVGEKQLICIARAILRKSKIIVMDEATANIDYQTEENIQKSLHDLLKESTIITIAHRIKTILSYDKVLVLDNGKIMEYDTPKNLLNDVNSIFYKLNHCPSNIK